MVVSHGISIVFGKPYFGTDSIDVRFVMKLCDNSCAQSLAQTPSPDDSTKGGTRLPPQNPPKFPPAAG